MLLIPENQTPNINGSGNTNGVMGRGEVLPPPAISDMPALSASAVAGFASAEKGVTTAEEAKQEGGNKEGLVVLNGSSS
jgi:hypothetical protein